MTVINTNVSATLASNSIARNERVKELNKKGLKQKRGGKKSTYKSMKKNEKELKGMATQ